MYFFIFWLRQHRGKRSRWGSGGFVEWTGYARGEGERGGGG